MCLLVTFHYDAKCHWYFVKQWIGNGSKELVHMSPNSVKYAGLFCVFAHVTQPYLYVLPEHIHTCRDYVQLKEW